MKKIAPIAAIALIAAMFTSCKKDYTCECSINGSVIGTTTIHDTKSKAKSQCNQTASFGGITASCTLK